jgi:hypothetical protein
MTGLCRSGKTAYPDEGTAEEALGAIRAENERMAPGRREPTRTYECDHCADWHLTSKPARRRRAL